MFDPLHDLSPASSQSWVEWITWRAREKVLVIPHFPMVMCRL